MYLPYDVLKNLIYFNDRINNLFEEKLKRYYSDAGISDGTNWSPVVDIYETGEDLYLTAEVPGVALKDVTIEVAGDELVLKGNRPFPKEGVKKEDYHRLEGSYGRFDRRFPLPGAVDKKSIKARLKDGILQVTIPKAPKRKITKIAIEKK